MPSVCLYFKIHQPYQLKKYAVQDIGSNHNYEDMVADEANINRVSDESYLRTNNLILELIKSTNKRFKVSYSISGTTLDLLQKYRPDVIESFKELIDTGCVEILAETYFHSLSFLYSKKEFERQVKKHSELVQHLFGKKTSVFRNTELIYNNQLAAHIASLGYKGILCEGVDRLLNGRSPNKVYASTGIETDFTLLLRNAGLSDDIAFRFGEENWNEHPLTAEKFAEWIHKHTEDTKLLNLFMDYETFGIHKKDTTGIFDFLQALPHEILKNESWKFNTPSEAIDAYFPEDFYNVAQTISWKDKSKECCVWCENMMQNNTLKKIYSLEKMVSQSSDEKLKEMWGRLQAADYFYFMADESCHHQWYHNHNHYQSAKEVYHSYTNILTDFEITLIQKALKTTQPFHNTSVGVLY